MAVSGKRKASQDGEQQQVKRAKTGGFIARARELLFPCRFPPLAQNACRAYTLLSASGKSGGKNKEQIGGGRVDASLSQRTHLPTPLKVKPFDLTSSFSTLQPRPLPRPRLFSQNSAQHAPQQSTPLASTSALPRAFPSPPSTKTQPSHDRPLPAAAGVQVGR